MIDFARRLTAASFTGVGWAIPQGWTVRWVLSCWAVISSIAELLASQHKGIGVHLEVRMAGQCVGRGNVKQQRVPWLDVL